MKNHTVRCLICAFLIFFVIQNASPLFSEAAASDRNIFGSGSDYTAILYDSANGLPTSEANAIAQSGDGFIWLGGYSGLIRYDGSNFERFDSSSGISSVFSLYVDSSDRVWIGTNENGVACYDHGEIRIYGRVEGLKSYSIRDMTEDKDGNIIIATTQGLAYIGEDLEIHIIDDAQVNLEYITQLERDSAGEIFGLTSNGAVFEIDKLRITAFYDPEKFGSDPVNCIYADPEIPGQLYMGTIDTDILTVMMDNDINIVKKQNADPQKNIKSMLKIGDRLWIAATNGIGYFDEKSVYHELADVPMNNSVGNIMLDHEGNMWFTSTRQGVLKLVPDRFTDLSKLAGLDSMVVNSTCIYDKLLYIASDNGLVILNSTTYAPVTNELTELLTDVRIRCIKSDSKGNLWLCTHGETGLVQYDPASGDIKIFNEENGLETGKVRAVMECADGRIAAATGNGLFILKDDQVVSHYGQDNGISTEEILSIAEDAEGTLYLGSDGDGIYVVKEKKVSRLSFDDGLTSGVVMRIKWDPERQVFWLITSNSIEYMKDGVITPVTNFPYSNNYDIYFDDHGGAWVLASNGIYITKVDELMKNGKIEYTFYNTRSGLPYIATGNSRSYIDDSGHLYISGTTGICIVDINSEDGASESVKLAIPSVDVDDREIPIREGDIVSLPAGSRRLVINAYALTYGLSNPRISYQLLGFDNEVITTTKQDMQPVIYTNLDGGRYTFNINVIDNETGEIINTSSLVIVKETSLYESIIFWIMLMIILSLLVGFLIWRHFRKKNEELLAKQEEDRQFINQIMHTFARCIDLRDTQNQGHSFRVAHYTRMLCEKLADKRGYTQEVIDQFYHSALVHDIGKLSIPDAILNKTSRLDDEEFEKMKTHAAAGEELLKGVRVVKDLAVGAGCHHEHLDGKGYPRHLSGDEIPEVARVIAVADTFDAMFSTRPYRKQMPLEDVLNEIKRVRGTQLEADVVDALLELAAENRLDKEIVEEAIRVELESESGDEPEEEKDTTSDDPGSEFQKSLGLHNED